MDGRAGKVSDLLDARGPIGLIVQTVHVVLLGGRVGGILAREKSVDPTSADGGFLGKIDPASLRAELRDALRGVQPGQISKIVKLPSAYAILEVMTETEAADLGKADRALQAAIRPKGP